VSFIELSESEIAKAVDSERSSMDPEKKKMEERYDVLKKLLEELEP
jgi:hypothetical protein